MIPLSFRFTVKFCALTLVFALVANAEGTRTTDFVDLASSASRGSHRVVFFRGRITSEKFDIGALSLPVSGIQLEPGGSVRSSVTVSRNRIRCDAIVLTLATAPRDYGKRQQYRVQLNGKQVYAASEIDPGGGFTRSLVLEPPGLERVVELEVSEDPESQAPVIVSFIRCFGSTASTSSARTPARLKMGLALLTSKGYGYALDVQTMREIVALQPRCPYLEPELALVYNFCSRDKQSNEAEINRLASMAEETGIPLRVAYQFHWGGIPRDVPDSGGVTFSDPPYQMITYDPDDHVDDPGLAAVLGDRYDVRYGLSIPNIWSNTPWLSFNQPRLNRFRKKRLDEVLEAWHAARKRLATRGKAYLLPAELSTGEETVYWAKGVDDSLYTVLNGGTPRSHLMADFNPSVVADARRDGVALDPRDGLDLQERWWLHQNMAHWQQKIVDWMIEASPPDPICFDGGKPVFAADLVRRNIYTEPYAMPLYPMKDVNSFHPGIEVGYVRDGRSGGEYWSGATIVPWLQKERERGRIALPNIECTVTDDGQLVSCLRAAYSFGARFSTVYNWHPRPNTAELLKAFADSIDVPPGLAWLPSALGHRDPQQRKPQYLSVTYTRTYHAPASSFGINCIELFPVPGASAPTLVRVTLRKPHPQRDSTQEMSVSVRTPRNETNSRFLIFLPTVFRQEPNQQYELRVEQPGGEAADLALGADSLIACRLVSDLMLERSRSLMIEDWQDAADILASLRARLGQPAQSPYAKQALKEATRLFASGMPQEAYREAIKAEQLALPSAFELSMPGGKLSPYPIIVRCPEAPVQIVVRTFGPRSAILSVSSESPQTVTVRLGKIEKSSIVSADRPSEMEIDRRP